MPDGLKAIYIIFMKLPVKTGPLSMLVLRATIMSIDCDDLPDTSYDHEKLESTLNKLLDNLNEFSVAKNTLSLLRTP